MAIRRINKGRVTITLQKGDRFIRKRIPSKIMRALFDVGFMLDDIHDTLELNKIDKETYKFFSMIQHLVFAMDDNTSYAMESKNFGLDYEFVETKKKHYVFGKPKWRKVKKDGT